MGVRPLRTLTGSWGIWIMPPSKGSLVKRLRYCWLDRSKVNLPGVGTLRT